MTQTIDIDEAEVEEEAARLVRAVIGETHLSSIELAAVLARSFQQPGFLPLPVLDAFLRVAQRFARIPSVITAGSGPAPPSAEREALVELLRDGEWLDALGERAAAFQASEESFVHAADADVARASDRMVKKFGPLYEKLAK